MILSMILIFVVIISGVISADDQMVLVPAGTSSDYVIDDEFHDGTSSLEDITLEYDLLAAKHLVTFAEYDEFAEDVGKDKPSGFDEAIGFDRETFPVVNISWLDAVEYCNWLSAQEGLEPAYDTSGDHEDWDLKDDPENLEGYRLPIEEEWEYTARGGADGEHTKYAGSDDVDEVAWHRKNSTIDEDVGRQPHPVGQKKPNELGIYDMSGLVMELTNTFREHDGSYDIILRSGQYKDWSDRGQLKYHTRLPTCDDRDWSYTNQGFRIFRTYK